MSQPSNPQDPRPLPDFRGEMKSATTAQIASLGDPLIKVDPNNLDATARNPSVAHMATLRTFAVQNSKDKHKSVTALMNFWERSYQSISIGHLGKARDEYGKFANLAAAGGGPLGGNEAFMQPLLNESGTKTAAKAHFWSRKKQGNQ